MAFCIRAERIDALSVCPVILLEAWARMMMTPENFTCYALGIGVLNLICFVGFVWFYTYYRNHPIAWMEESKVDITYYYVMHLICLALIYLVTPAYLIVKTYVFFG